MCSGHCLKNSTCHVIDGTCISGCQDGFKGNLCNDSCREGYYGRNCSRSCPSNCKACKATDGTCSCDAGWMGPNCSIGCVWTYGEDCRFPCGKHCVNQICDRFNGSCLSGCDSGFHGEKCDQKYASTTSVLSAVSSGILGASVSACVFFTAGIVIPFIWRKRFCFSGKPSNSNKESHYAEIENQLSGVSTYQELTVSKTNKEYENLELQ
uniref:Multiple epidermal growth factor-like domains protein 10 n=1 Tax=Crassostrea virginica TaxID=6565 RepID=A0A8B8C7P4_CRAVI|nr:multiple epidermal growth factor-like domains protein 10 [Crassostrea virginica]